MAEWITNTQGTLEQRRMAVTQQTNDGQGRRRTVMSLLTGQGCLRHTI